MNYEELLSTCDSHIKSGKINIVAELVGRMNLMQVPREWRQALAKVCRRSGLIEYGLRLLQPIIRNEQELNDPATAGEICEYAVLLSRNGSIREALVWLEKVDENIAPEALLYQGFCHISNWNCQQAAVHLEKFLQSKADSYSKLIARVNLGASYLANGQLLEAETILSETIELAQSAAASRLVGNCFELRGQVHFRRNNFAKARIDLNRGLEIIGQNGTYDQLLIFKWQSIINATETNSLAPIEKFREEALFRKHWESVREADLFRVKLKFDQQNFDHLIFGTPLEFYRKRIRQEVAIEPSTFFIHGPTNSRQLDLATGQLAGLDDLNPGKKIHQMLAALLKDFYAPRNIGSLFAEIYPDEYFDIDSSPNRLRQNLRRTRRWLEANEIPALITESNGSYSFVTTGPFSFNIPFEHTTIGNFTVQWQETLKAFSSQKSFTAEEAVLKLGISRSSFLRFANWSLENKLMAKSGIGKATIYQISRSVISRAS